MISPVKVLSKLFIFCPQLFIFFAVLALHCCAGLSRAVVSGVYSPDAVHGSLIAVASLVLENRLWGLRTSVVAARGLSNCSSLALEHRLSCSAACGIFPDQGSNRCLLNWQTSSLPLSHQGSLSYSFLKNQFLVLLFFLYYFSILYFIYLHSVILSFLLLAYGMVCSSFASSFSCNVWLLI